MSAIPVIETDRLRLRAPSEADFAQMQEYLGQERIVFIGGPFDAVGVWRTLLYLLMGFLLVEMITAWLFGRSKQ